MNAASPRPSWPAKPSTPMPPEEELARLMAKAAKAENKAVSGIGSQFGVTERSAVQQNPITDDELDGALAFIRANPRCTASDIAAHMGTTPRRAGAMTQHLRRDRKIRRDKAGPKARPVYEVMP